MHSAYRLICSDNAQKNANVANVLFCEFVKLYPRFYTLEKLSYNVHNLLHIADDVKQYGQADSYSAYKFENHMQMIKRDVRVSNHTILQQLANRIADESSADLSLYRPKNGLFLRSTLQPHDDCKSRYLGYKFNQYVLKNNLSDSCGCIDDIIPFLVQELKKKKW